MASGSLLALASHLQAAGDFHLLKNYILVEEMWQFMIVTCKLIVKLCLMRIFSISIIWMVFCA
jgi:hypothetical protein